MSKNINDYDIIKKLGSGAFGTVYKVKRKDGKIIALKVMNVSKTVINIINKEVLFLKELSINDCHPFIVCYYNSFYSKDNKRIFIEMEYIDGIEMFDFVVNSANTKSNILYRLLVLIAKDIAEGLKYIHSKGIIHNDIKLENIIIENVSNIPKIIDFGLACNMKSDRDYCKSRSGSPNYIPPEALIIPHKRYTASDMWALGIVLYVGAMGFYPYTDLDKNLLFKKIKTNKPPKLLTTNITLNTIVNNLLIKDHTKRLTAEGVLDIIKSSNNHIKNVEFEEKSFVLLNREAMSSFLFI